MPYIKKERRKLLDKKIKNLLNTMETHPGEYNYVITKLLHDFTMRKGIGYETLNATVGIAECAKAEFIRTVVSPYEDKKRLSNGEISFLDVL